MRKRQTARIERELNRLKKDFPVYTLTNHLDLGRFLKPEIFEYSNQIRLKRMFKDRMIEQFKDLEIVFQNLSNKHKKEILTSEQFLKMIDVLLDNASQVRLKRIVEKNKDKVRFEMQDNIDDLSSAVMYQNFFNIGFEGLIESMPYEFREYLITQVKPITQLMYAITKNYNKISKGKIPEPQFPKILTKSHIRSDS